MSIREVVTLALAGGLAALALLVACGCGGEAGRRAQLRSNNPLDRAEAIVRVYDTRDRRAAQKLVDLLDDPSSAVRMYAILALRGLTGEDFGYRYYDSEGARAASVQRWRDGVRDVAISVLCRSTLFAARLR